MCYASLVMLRGRYSCAISSHPSRSPAFKSQLSPLFPLHPRNSPVTPLFPLHTQKQGGGGASNEMCSPITLLFSIATLTSRLSTIVGAPTFAYAERACRVSGAGGSLCTMHPGLAPWANFCRVLQKTADAKGAPLALGERGIPLLRSG